MFTMTLDYLRSWVGSTEESKVSLGYFAMTFLSIITLRTFLGFFSSPSNTAFIPGPYIHWYISWIAIALIIMLILRFFSQESMGRIFRVAICFFALILIVPLIDLVVSGGAGYYITYLSPAVHTDIWQRFFTFFGEPMTDLGFGPTPGQKVEILCAVLLGSYYVFIKRSNVLLSVLSGFCLYITIFAWMALPFFLAWFLRFFDIAYRYSDSLFLGFYLIILPIIGIVFAYLWQPRYVRAIMADMRILRLAYYELIFMFGAALAVHQGFGTFYPEMVFQLPIILLSIAFAWLSALMQNNLADRAIDRISNIDRPLVRGTVPLPIYQRIAWVFFACALTYALLVSFTAFFVIFLFVGNYFIYSMPPLRLKRILFLSKFLIAFNILAVALLGFQFFAKWEAHLPIMLYPVILIGGAFALNFIDIKDYAGDKVAGIHTLPVVMGLWPAKRLIGFFNFGAYLLAFLLVRDVYFLPVFAMLGALQFYFINKADYSDEAVMLVNNISIFLLISYFLYLT